MEERLASKIEFCENHTTCIEHLQMAIAQHPQYVQVATKFICKFPAAVGPSEFDAMLDGRVCATIVA
eukprot:scaffold8363_cov58-Attheya_sp.AAC.4